MSTTPTSVYKALFGNAHQTQYSDFVVVEHPMNGAFVSTAMAFRSAQSWAAQTRSSGNAFRDKQQFLSRLPVVVASKSGTLAASKGGAQQIAELARSMQGAGLDLNGWDVPPALLKPANKPAQEPAPERVPEMRADETSVEDPVQPALLPQENPVVVAVDFRRRRRA